ncbi:hypothetical protein HT094_00005, partial [Shewanella sp. ZOR0012]|nr:hypothetical protein [Shewanella sp. ZOR0012]
WFTSIASRTGGTSTWHLVPLCCLGAQNNAFAIYNPTDFSEKVTLVQQ